MQHVAELHAVERVVLPRCLVPRPTSAIVIEEYVLEVAEGLDAAELSGDWDRFKVGDVITFEDWDGLHRVITILGIRGRKNGVGGYADCMVYNGQPHYLMATFQKLSKLRILKLDTMSLRDVKMYRRLLSLNVAIKEAAA
jgi:hypothetical protein